jgi:putative glutamine amidotransferase
MQSPVIGLTTNRLASTNPLAPNHGVSEAYVQAISNAGGLPLLIPLGLPEHDWQALAARLDGILFTGGSDLDPAIFNGTPHPRVYDVDPDRDALEIALARHAAGTGRPFLGICRGAQAVNVALGGTLYTDITDQVPGALRHDWYPDIPRGYRAHPVALDPSSQLAGILGTIHPQVNSLHHQGLQHIGAGLAVTGQAPDGIVESVELPGHPFGIAVQWHPEWLQDDPAMRALFRAFIEAAAGGH